MKVNAKRKSFHTCVKIYIPTTNIPGALIGKTTFMIVWKLLHPSINAALRTSLGMVLKKPSSKEWKRPKKRSVNDN